MAVQSVAGGSPIASFGQNSECGKRDDGWEEEIGNDDTANDTNCVASRDRTSPCSKEYNSEIREGLNRDDPASDEQIVHDEPAGRPAKQLSETCDGQKRRPEQENTDCEASNDAQFRQDHTHACVSENISVHSVFLSLKHESTGHTDAVVRLNGSPRVAYVRRDRRRVACAVLLAGGEGASSR